MHNTAAIFKKQLKDTLHNKTVLIQFVMFPAMTLIMQNTVRPEGIPQNFFVTLFATMYIGMAPLTSMAAILAEEKEKNTLRVLILSNVKPQEFLLGVGSYIWLACMLGGGVICAAGSCGLREAAAFMGVLAAGILTSLLIGAAIGVWSKTQMMATSVAVPVMMVFSFVPMLAIFNEHIGRAARLLYSGQISRMLDQIGSLQLGLENAGVVGLNILAAALLFAIAYKKCGLD